MRTTHRKLLLLRLKDHKTYSELDSIFIGEFRNLAQIGREYKNSLSDLIEKNKKLRKAVIRELEKQ